MGRSAVERVCEAPEAYCVRMPFSNLGRGTSNCYIAKQGRDWLIVDTGAESAEGRRALVEAFSALGVDFRRTQVFFTHMHFDHAEAARSCLPGGVRVFASQEGVVSRMPKVRASIQRQFFRRMVALGAPEDDARAYAACNSETAFVDPAVFDVRYASDGDVLDVGGVGFRVVATPGHTPDHLCLYQPESRLLFGGDAVLFTTTPSIDSFPDTRDGYALFEESLERLAALDVERSLLGHGKPVYGPLVPRVAEIRSKKHAKLARVLALVSSHPGETGEAVARRFACKDFASWHADPPISRYYAMLETFVLLQHLALSGRIERTMDFDLGAYRFFAL